MRWFKRKERGIPQQLTGKLVVNHPGEDHPSEIVRDDLTWSLTPEKTERGGSIYTYDFVLDPLEFSGVTQGHLAVVIDMMPSNSRVMMPFRARVNRWSDKP